MSVKNGVVRSRRALAVDVARKAIGTVIGKRGARPMGALAWFRSLAPERQASLRKRYLGHFGPPASSNDAPNGQAKNSPASKRTKTTRVR